MVWTDPNPLRRYLVQPPGHVPSFALAPPGTLARCLVCEEPLRTREEIAAGACRGSRAL